MIPLRTIVTSAGELLLPLMLAAARETEFNSLWDPGGPWIKASDPPVTDTASPD